MYKIGLGLAFYEQRGSDVRPLEHFRKNPNIDRNRSKFAVENGKAHENVDMTRFFGVGWRKGTEIVYIT